jgi:hypothetical protein
MFAAGRAGGSWKHSFGMVQVESLKEHRRGGLGVLGNTLFAAKMDCPLWFRRTGPLFGRLPLAEGKAKRAEK